MNQPTPLLCRAARLLRIFAAFAAAAGTLVGTLELHPSYRRDVHDALAVEQIDDAARHPTRAAHVESAGLEHESRCPACLLALGLHATVAAAAAVAPATVAAAGTPSPSPRRDDPAADLLPARGPPSSLLT